MSEIVKALFVEDEPDLYEDIASNLRIAIRDCCERHVEFRLVTTVEKAKELLPPGQSDFQLVVTDMLFPRIGSQGLNDRGTEVIHQARLTAGVIVVAITQGHREFPRLDRTATEAGAHIVRYKQEITEDSRNGNWAGWESIARDICVALEGLQGGAARASGAASDSEADEVARRRVFVVYGRREELVSDLFGFLQALSLEPMEWDALVSMTIQQKGTGGNPDNFTIIRTGFRNAHGCVVMFSPDDEARILSRLHKASDGPEERKLRGQPRQNVLLEAGYALAYDQAHTLIVTAGTVRPISDLSGMDFAHLDNTSASRKAIAQRLRDMGFAVRTEGKLWLSQGDFEC